MRLIQYTIQHVFKINGYFSEIFFWALAIAVALFDTTAENFLGPIVHSTFSISSSSNFAVWLTFDKSRKE